MSNVEGEIHIMVVGSTSVGKTSLITSYKHGEPALWSRVTTSIDIIEKKIVIDKKIYDVKVYDTAGSDRDGRFLKCLLNRINIIVFAFDVSTKGQYTSLFETLEWKTQIQNHVLNSQNIMYAMLGTRSDLNYELHIDYSVEHCIPVNTNQNDRMRPITDDEIHRLADEKIIGKIHWDTNSIKPRAELYESVTTVSNRILDFNKQIKDFEYCYITSLSGGLFGVKEFFNKLIGKYIENVRSLKKMTLKEGRHKRKPVLNQQNITLYKTITIPFNNDEENGDQIFNNQHVPAKQTTTDACC